MGNVKSKCTNIYFWEMSRVNAQIFISFLWNQKLKFITMNLSIID